MSKKSIIAFVGALVMLYSCPGRIFASNPDTLSFIHVSDLHFANLAGYHPTFVKGRKHYGSVTSPLTHFFRTVPQNTNADFITVTGDIIDYFEAETATGQMLGTQVEQFASLINDINVPVPIFFALGNHDIASYWIDPSSNRITSHQDHAGQARASWIRNVPAFREGTYYSKVFQVGDTNFRLIFLDNGYYTPEGPAVNPFMMDPYQLYWLDRELKKSESDIEIIFMHIPLTDPDPADLVASRNKYHLDLKDTIPIKHEPDRAGRDTLGLFRILEKHSSVRLAVTGHKHSSVFHEILISESYSLPQLMTGAFARDARNWRLIQLTEDNIIISFPGNTRTQYQIPLK